MRLPNAPRVTQNKQRSGRRFAFRRPRGTRAFAPYEAFSLVEPDKGGHILTRRGTPSVCSQGQNIDSAVQHFEQGVRP